MYTLPIPPNPRLAINLQSLQAWNRRRHLICTTPRAPIPGASPSSYITSIHRLLVRRHPNAGECLQQRRQQAPGTTKSQRLGALQKGSRPAVNITAHIILPGLRADLKLAALPRPKRIEKPNRGRGRGIPGGVATRRTGRRKLWSPRSSKRVTRVGNIHREWGARQNLRSNRRLAGSGNRILGVVQHNAERVILCHRRAQSLTTGAVFGGA